MISDNARAGMQQAPARSLFNALGFTAEELKKPYFAALAERVDAAYAASTVYPPREALFAAFRMTPPEAVSLALQWLAELRSCSLQSLSVMVLQWVMWV